MSASAARPTEHLHPDEQTLAEYSAVSRSAVLALCLGLASPLVLISPLLVLVPLAAVTAAIVALRGIQASGGQLLGRWPATLGLCLAVLFSGWGFSRQWTRQTLLSEHAEQFVNGWLRICQEGKLQMADQLMQPPSARLHSDEAIAEFYRTNKEAEVGIDSFFSREPMKTFLAVGKNSRVELSIAGRSQNGYSDDVVFRCDYRPREDADQADKAASGTFWVSVTREDMPESAAPGWKISRVDASAPLSLRQ
jgi:hypothetical protein